MFTLATVVRDPESAALACANRYLALTNPFPSGRQSECVYLLTRDKSWLGHVFLHPIQLSLFTQDIYIPFHPTIYARSETLLDLPVSNLQSERHTSKRGRLQRPMQRLELHVREEVES
jgi:hypothetical protein